MKEIKTGIADINFDKGPGILYVTITQDAVIDLASLKEHYKKIMQITRGEKYRALIDATHACTIYMEALEFAATSDAMKNRVAAAYCNPPLLNRLNIRSLQKLLGQAIPTAIFSTKQEALLWLERFEKK